MTLPLPTINMYSVRIADQSMQQQQQTGYLASYISQKAAYVAGGVFAALVISTAATGVLARRPAFLAATIGSICLTSSMFLLACSNGTNKPMIQAHLVLNYSGGYILVLASSLVTNGWTNEGRKQMKRYILAKTAVFILSVVAAAGAVIMDCIGVPLAGYADPGYARAGRLLHLAAACCALVSAGLSVVMAMTWGIKRSADRIGSFRWTGLVGSLVLALWSGFSVACASLPGWERSRVVWFLLGVLPLALAQVAWLVENMAGALSHHRLLGWTLEEKKQKQKQKQKMQWTTVPLDFSYPLRSGGGRPRK
ncbi:hypothetical protein LPJ64_005748 [Coemansia asiatica]|uniref:Uncharacterized protein n=1 Tax=Coemansia asiatica TaxID=1052880 RepID=A0A9W8CHC7_9FUNG|nr:hypothetical protein LPJ64_005748 [Coemansia asiatica]